MRDGRIAKLELVSLNLPMRQPFVTALGSKRVSRNLLVKLRLDGGIVGLGEASASLAWPKESQPAMRAALKPLENLLIGAQIARFRRLAESAWELAGEHPTAAAALECALLDAYTRLRGVPLWRFCGGKRRSITTGLTLSAWAPAQAARAAGEAWTAGVGRFKVKVAGRNPGEDFRRVAAVRQAAPRAQIWIDGNQGFTVKEAVRFASMLRAYSLGVRLFEQPVARENREGLAQVQQEGKIPVAADESARTISEALEIIRGRGVHAINIKLAKSGFFGALRIIRRAKKAGVRLMIGCMAESAIGLSPSVHLACGTNAFDFIDLDSHLLVVSPAGDPGFRTRGDHLSVYPNRPGCGARLR